MSMASVDTKRVFGTALPLAMGVSAGLNLVVYGVATQLLEVPLAIAHDPGMPLAPLKLVDVLVASIVPAVMASILLALLGWFVKWPVLVFVSLSVVAFVMSLLVPLDVIAGAIEVGDERTRWILATMHAIAATSIVTIFVRFSRR